MGRRLFFAAAANQNRKNQTPKQQFCPDLHHKESFPFKNICIELELTCPISYIKIRKRFKEKLRLLKRNTEFIPINEDK
jgi:hypothetical protein